MFPRGKYSRMMGSLGGISPLGVVIKNEMSTKISIRIVYPFLEPLNLIYLTQFEIYLLRVYYQLLSLRPYQKSGKLHL
jgi:hypothetical protein